jgi:hypothetical protein
MLGPITVALLPLVEVKEAVPMVRFMPAAVGTVRLQGRKGFSSSSRVDGAVQV